MQGAAAALNLHVFTAGESVRQKMPLQHGSHMLSPTMNTWRILCLMTGSAYTIHFLPLNFPVTFHALTAIGANNVEVWGFCALIFIHLETRKWEKSNNTKIITICYADLLENNTFLDFPPTIVVHRYTKDQIGKCYDKGWSCWEWKRYVDMWYEDFLRPHVGILSL